MTFRNRIQATALVLALVPLASACLNDRDTLADEARKNRDVLATLVGGFERNPPLYYEMRIARIEKELAVNPASLELYDDIGVANDRIGKDDDAIKWIEAKRAHMSPLDMKNEASREQWYRYYANVGTFWAHRWAKSGAKPDRIEELENASDLIQKALQINPNAHFGREKYQLVVMKWLISNAKSSPMPLSMFIQDPGLSPVLAEDRRYGLMTIAQADEAITGLSGLIRLGGAWQSADVYMAIASLYGTRRGPMASVALLRAKEILQSGGKSLNPEFTTIDDELYHGPRASALNASETREYQRLRAVAEKWNNERQAFMLGRLRAGRHPDTDARFWDGVPALPDLSVHEGLFTFLGAKVFTPTKIMMGLFFLVIASPFLIVAYLVARGYRRRRAQSVH